MKTLLFNIQQGGQLKNHIEAVLALAEKYGSHVIACHVTPLLSSYLPASHGYFVADDAVSLLVEKWRAIARDTRQVFESHWPEGSPSWEWREEVGNAEVVLGEQARTADLTIVAIGDQELLNGKPAWSLASDITLSNGFPVLALPTDSSPPLGAKPVICAWDGSLEAAHAIKQALPILRSASEIIVVEVNDDKPNELPTADIAPYLARHGLKVDGVNRVPEDTVAQELLEVARIHDAELIVMGAYGHTRLREFIFGGVTRDMLKTTDIPLLICN